MVPPLCSRASAGGAPAPQRPAAPTSSRRADVGAPSAPIIVRAGCLWQGHRILTGVTPKPAVGLVAVAGRRRATLEMAQRLEREGFTGLYCPSPGDGLALCQALAQATREISFGTSIANIYTRHPFDYAQTAAVVHELSGGRFRFGIGVSHGPTHERLGLKTGKPLDDIKKFVGEVTAAGAQVGALPPIVLATLRRRMVELAGEIAQGAVWANGARSHMAASLRHLPERALNDPAFFIGNMVPTCIDDDRAAAAAVMRRTLASYVRLPN